MKKIGVLLSGCGVKDGSEIHEATLTLLYLAQKGAQAVCLAPDAPQPRVVDHLTNQAAEPARNMLTESARIARGDIRPLAKITANQLDGLILPGGLGAALNLCDYAARGRDFRIRDDVAQLLLALHEQKKPIGAICIAPVLLAGLFGPRRIPVAVTIGNDEHTAADIAALGAKHVTTDPGQAHVDREQRIATCAAYMCGHTVADIAPGIEKVVAAVLEMAE